MLTLLTNKRHPNLKNLIFSLLNLILKYDCDGYMIPYVNTYQANKYVDPLIQASIETLLILSTHHPLMLNQLEALLNEGDVALTKICEYYG